MNPIQELCVRINEEHPKTSMALMPTLSTDVWFLEIVNDGNIIVVEWSESTNFGISHINSNDEYGERPTNTFLTIEDIHNKVNEILCR